MDISNVDAVMKLRLITMMYGDKAKEYFGGKTANIVECCNSSIAKAVPKDRDFSRSYSMLANIGVRNYEEGSSWKQRFQQFRGHTLLKFTRSRLARLQIQREKGKARKKSLKFKQRRKVLKQQKKQRNSATSEQIQQGYTYKEATAKKKKSCSCQPRQNGVQCDKRCGCTQNNEKCHSQCKCRMRCSNNMGIPFNIKFFAVFLTINLGTNFIGASRSNISKTTKQTAIQFVSASIASNSISNRSNSNSITLPSITFTSNSLPIPATVSSNLVPFASTSTSNMSTISNLTSITSNITATEINHSEIVNTFAKTCNCKKSKNGNQCNNFKCECRKDGKFCSFWCQCNNKCNNNDSTLNIKSNTYLIIWDTETTGFSPTTDRIVELFLLVANSGDTWQAYINPQRELTPEASKTNKLTWEILKQYETFSTVGTNFLAFVNKIDTLSTSTFMFVSHNGSFDQRMLKAEFARNGLILPSNWIFGDSEGILKKFVPPTTKMTNHSLQSYVNTFVSNTTIQHEAKDYVQKLWQVIQHLIPNPVPTICNIVSQKNFGGKKRPTTEELPKNSKKQKQ